MTIGFVYDSGIEHRNSVDASAVTARPNVRVRCPLCDELLDAESAAGASPLERHLSHEHPLDRPRMMVAGRDVGRHQLDFRQPIDASAVWIGNATRIDLAVDGRPSKQVDARELAETIGRASRTVLAITLHNERAAGHVSARARIRLRFDVPDAATLDAVDSAFTEAFGDGALSRLQLEAFVRGTDAGDPQYRDALYSYAAGVLKRDRAQAGGQADLAVAERHLKVAADALSSFTTRAVAATALSASRLMLNHFAADDFAAAGRLQNVRHVLRQVIADGRLDPSVGCFAPTLSGALCPVDTLTDLVVEATERLQVADSDSIDLGSLIEHLAGVGVTAADRIKIALVAGEAACRRGDHDVRLQSAQVLKNDALFRNVLSRWERHDLG